MKPAPRPNYKKLYLESLEQIASQREVLALSQQQQVRMVEERKTFLSIITGQQEQLAGQQTRLHQLQEENRLCKQTISRQTAKIAEQQKVITEQDNLVTQQQKQLDKNEKELSRLTRIEYELRMLKRRIYGIKSEKSHTGSGEGDPQAGRQLMLSLEVDSWGICSINDRRRIAEHLRVIKSTTPKKPGGRYDLPEGLEEEIIFLDVPDRPAGAIFIRYEDQSGHPQLFRDWLFNAHFLPCMQFTCNDMDKYNELQPGNLVEYRGPLGANRFALIDRIDKMDKDRYPIWFAPRRPLEKEFVGYSDEISPIILFARHLTVLGFTFLEKPKRYTLGKVGLGEFRSISGDDPMHLRFVDWGIRVVIDSHAVIRTPEDLEKYTVALLYLHSLQNYLSEQGEKVDVSVFW